MGFLCHSAVFQASQYLHFYVHVCWRTHECVRAYTHKHTHVTQVCQSKKYINIKIPWSFLKVEKIGCAFPFFVFFCDSLLTPPSLYSIHLLCSSFSSISPVPCQIKKKSKKIIFLHLFKYELCVCGWIFSTNQIWQMEQKPEYWDWWGKAADGLFENTGQWGKYTSCPSH